MVAFWRHLDKLESYVCRVLLACFVTLLFVQIIIRQIGKSGISWIVDTATFQKISTKSTSIEELSVILFVWFAYFGASYAARMAAHNRVTFHINAMPRQTARIVEAIGDVFWIAFNVTFIWFAIKFLSGLKPFYKAQTLGWPMKYVMLVLPIAFALMTIRILQVNYMKLVMGIDPRDPDKVEVEAAMEFAEDEAAQFKKGHPNG